MPSSLANVSAINSWICPLVPWSAHIGKAPRVPDYRYSPSLGGADVCMETSHDGIEVQETHMGTARRQRNRRPVPGRNLLEAVDRVEQQIGNRLVQLPSR